MLHLNNFYPSINGTGKGKVRPTTGHEGPERKMYSYTLSLTSELGGDEWSSPSPGSFTPGKDPVPIVWEAGWTTGPVWTDGKYLAPHRDSIPEPSSP